ncbi:hypothetical protein Rleg4DRAFT_6239 [Rhizobium leguminosarum bv. trifolii WSM2297]|uniref:Uncharacterized protein n=1 Tax=Rhizobium leguminosarum bv. trifolii WSM2297 TaxID=754762 RepID=J0L1E2_RHILT|nr:hypothetical protein Rleg4DRAFT_5783 [Rhizobium leguminosarum bv. trifolii WSM2297]EJC84415.1 hypothetical protein Rleg4DRAFT_6239 [Rhizobium leguminosarum bv. trifolii WSM2297]
MGRRTTAASFVRLIISVTFLGGPSERIRPVASILALIAKPHIVVAWLPQVVRDARFKVMSFA